MISLFLDTSDKNIIVAISKDENIVFFSSEQNDNHLSERFLPIINEAFKAINLSINEVDQIIVSNGPGSFTGIRVGVTVAKVIASELKIKIITVSSLEVIATTYSTKKYIAPIIDARRGYVYSALYNNKLKKIIEPKYVLYSDFIDYLKENYSLEDIEFVSNYDYENKIYPDFDISKIFDKYKKAKSLIPSRVNPEYLKKTEAEEKMENK